MRSQAKIAAGGGLVAVILGAASLAWACTAQLGVNVKPEKVPAGGATTVSGEGSPGPVEIRWNAVDGPVIGRAADGSAFAVGVRIPDAAPGAYTLMAVNNSSGTAEAGRAVVEVVPATAGAFAGSTSPSVDLWSNSGGASGSGPSPLVLGVALMVGGSVLLVSGFAVAEVRRRKVLASS